jgi:hypothetical protein
MQLNIENLHTKYVNIIEEHVKNMEDIIRPINIHPEGNSFYEHSTLKRYPDLLNKQKNLVWCGTNIYDKVCEIGFNGGHSAMLLLLGINSRNIKFQVFDIGEHNYVEPCMEYIKYSFPNVDINYVKGDSRLTIPNWIFNNKNEIGTFDVLHLDGGHDVSCVYNDMAVSCLLLRKGGLLIVDDIGLPWIRECADRLINNGYFENVDVLPTIGYDHVVLRKIK